MVDITCDIHVEVTTVEINAGPDELKNDRVFGTHQKYPARYSCTSFPRAISTRCPESIMIEIRP
jgi:hypothetical protein